MFVSGHTRRYARSPFPPKRCYFSTVRADASAYGVLHQPVATFPGGRKPLKRFGEFCLDPANACLWREGARILVPPKPFAVLQYLVDHPGRLVTHDELLDAIWPETYVQPQILRTYMLDLRKALCDDAREPRYIESIPKRGYCFIAQVTDGTDAPLARSRPAVAEPLRAPLIGREQELASLAEHLELAAHGTRQIVFLTGETGIGKTALIDTWRHQAANMSGVCVAYTQCIPGFAERHEYYPVYELLVHLCDCSQTAATTLRAQAPAWYPAAPAAAGAPPRVPGDLCAALEAVARDTALILIFEDLQWADDATLDLIGALARRPAPARILLVASCTAPASGLPSRLNTLINDVLLRRLGTELSIARLNRAATEQLIASRLGTVVPDSSPGADTAPANGVMRITGAGQIPGAMQAAGDPAAIAGFVHQRSEGNPLFALAILDHLQSESLLTRSCGNAWQLRGSPEQIQATLPANVVRIIELEIAHLSAEERRLLEAGSLIPIAFPAWAVAAALDQDLAATEESLDDLARQLPFLRRAGEDELPDGTLSAFYVFTHGLYRDALYRRQSAGRRAERHVRIAERLRTLFASREDLVAFEMAAHFEAAGDWLRAVQMLRLAELHAASRSAHTTAADMRARARSIAAGRPTLLLEGPLLEQTIPAEEPRVIDAKHRGENLDDFSTEP